MRLPLVERSAPVVSGSFLNDDSERLQKFSVLRPGLLSNADTRKRVEQSKYVQEPQNDDDDHDGVQDGLNAAGHGYEAIHQPQQNAYYDQSETNLNERHNLFASSFAHRHSEHPEEKICPDAGP